MSTVSLIYNTIVGGKFYSAGDPIAKAILPSNLHKFISKPTSKSAHAAEESGPHLNFELNRRYSVDSEGFLRGSPARQAVQMEAEAAADDQLVDDLEEAEVSETVASAIEQAREDLQAEVEKEKLQARVRAERAEEAEEFLREEQDAAVENGEWDQWNADALRQPQERTAPRESAAPGVSAKSKSMAKPNSYVRRDGKFVPAMSVELIAGENLYWLRKRKFGQSERFIRYGKHRPGKES